MAVMQPYSQNMCVDTYAFMKTLTPQAGTYCYCQDTKGYYLFNGTSWIVGVTGSSSAPAAVAGTGAGSGSTITLAGNNKGGKITFVQGTGGVASGAIMVLTLADAVSYPTGVSITFSAGNSNFAGVLMNIYCQTSTSTVTLFLNGLVLTAGNTYIGYYHVDGY